MSPFVKSLFLRGLQRLRTGSLELVAPDGTREFGEPDSPLKATIAVHDERFYRRALFGDDAAIGESFMDGDWSSPDLTAVVRFAIRNLNAIEPKNPFIGALAGAFDTIRHKLRRNSVAGSRRNIQAHYDLSNDFFRLFLDRGMMYSCAFYQTPDDSLETAQFNKLDRICRKLHLGPNDHVLEIGTGWGGFAEHATRHYGCRVTSTTISDEQFGYATERLGSSAAVLKEDYRNLRGQYDKIVSIEMFEAVGFEYYDTFFSACDRLLKPDGSMLLQTITMNERSFPQYRRRSDWIQKHIFPGAQLASVTGILQSLTRATRLSLFDAEDIGLHYARTLTDWRERFHNSLDDVRALGFDERFIRMWDYYLSYCEGAFLERHAGDMQLVLTKARSLPNWRDESTASVRGRRSNMEFGEHQKGLREPHFGSRSEGD